MTIVKIYWPFFFFILAFFAVLFVIGNNQRGVAHDSVGVVSPSTPVSSILNADTPFEKKGVSVSVQLNKSDDEILVSAEVKLRNRDAIAKDDYAFLNSNFGLITVYDDSAKRAWTIIPSQYGFFELDPPKLSSRYPAYTFGWSFNKSIRVIDHPLFLLVSLSGSIPCCAFPQGDYTNYSYPYKKGVAGFPEGVNATIDVGAWVAGDYNFAFKISPNEIR